jgi:uncharacterized membrane protein SpoIIM required for sporulation
VRLVLLVLLAEYLALALFALLGYIYHGAVPPWFINMLRDRLHEVVTGPLAIFGHNAIIMTADSIPFVGPFALAVTLGATGFVLGAVVGYAAGQLGPLALAVGYLATVAMPHGILELSSYAFATAGSIDATRRLLSRRGGVLKTWLVHYAVALALLLAAAYVEWWELETIGPILSRLG